MNQPTQTIGRWTCPSGNRVDVVFTPKGHKLGDLQCIWDSPPRDPKDQAYYYKVIRPEAVMRAVSHKRKCINQSEGEHV